MLTDPHAVILAFIRQDERDVQVPWSSRTATTLNLVVKQRGRIRLRAANPRYPDTKPKRLEAQGVVFGVIRRKIV